MILQAEETRIYTPEEYFEFEVNSDSRHEYINLLASIPCEIFLADLYEGFEFQP